MVGLGGIRDEAATRDYLARNLDHWDEHGFGIWMLREAATDEHVGRVTLRWFTHPDVHDVEIGYALLPPYWGRGYATEAARSCLELARDGLGLETLIGVTTLGNRASEHVLYKLGLRVEREITVHGTACLLHRINWPAKGRTMQASRRFGN